MAHRPNNPGFHNAQRFSLLVASLFTFAAGALLAYPASARTLPEALQDTRVDFHLRAMMMQADQNAQAGVTAASAAAARNAAAAAGTPVQAVSIEQDYGQALPDNPVHLLIEGDVDRSALEALGVDVNTQVAGVTSAIAPLALVPALLDVAGIKAVHPAFVMKPQLDVSAVAVDALTAWGGTPPTYKGASGKGVVVGIIDDGLDLAHQDFKDATGHTRVKYLWDQGLGGTHPAGFTYGAEWNNTQIDAGQCTSVDADGHGTWVTGIAAGNGRATGNSQPAYKYVGIAPEADLVIVNALPYENGKIDAVNYIFQKAAALGEPAVINMSFGSNFGPHDGSYYLDTGISALTGPGKLVAAAVGNNGTIPVHAHVNIAATGGSAAVQFTIPTYTQSSVATEYVAVEGWHDLGDAFDIQLKGPSGTSSALVSPGTGTPNTSTVDGMTYVENAVASNNTAKAKRLYAYVWKGATSHPAAGTWTLTVTRKAGSANGVVDFWVATWALGTATPPSFIAPYLDATRTIMCPASADSVIAVGAYTTRSSWTNGTGGTSLVPGYPTVGNAAPFSAQGPLRDGRNCPELVAPGNGVISALAASVAPYTSSAWKSLDQVHRADVGTSAAAAHTTGALALLLQNAKTMTPSSARDLLRVQAKVDGATGAVPNNTYGYGKLDLKPGTTAVGDAATRRFSFAPPFPNPAKDLATFEFAITAEDLAAIGDAAPSVQIVDVAGRHVRSLAGAHVTGTQRLRWDGKDQSGAQAPTGVYFARLVVGQHTAIRKFVRLQD